MDLEILSLKTLSFRRTISDNFHKRVISENTPKIFSHEMDLEILSFKTSRFRRTIPDNFPKRLISENTTKLGKLLLYIIFVCLRKEVRRGQFHVMRD